MKRFNCDFGSRFRILKGGKISLVVSAILSSTTLVFAAPTGGVVTSGTADISQSGNTTNITQSTNKATINWQDFSIKSNETVNFNQPNVNSITLNRVVGNERSVIDGALNANGQVWILNSNGILFNKDSKINTAGILATTKNITDADFNAGNYKFTGDSTAGVINMGTIEASDSGYVALLANTVQNDGTIKAYKGTVHLTGASEATINLNGNSIVSLTVNKGVLDALVENKGAVLADGGKIFLTTNAVDEILKGVVNNSGLIEANSLDDISGTVELFAHGGTANVSGTIEAVGGFVETSGKELSVDSETVIKAKKWLIDPTDVTIESAGGAIGTASVSATAIETALETVTDVEIQATNDITVNQAININAATQTVNSLTLTAGNDININATITVGTDSALYLNHGWNGDSSSPVYDDVVGSINMGMNADKTGFIGKVNFLTRVVSDVHLETNSFYINDAQYLIIRDLSALQFVWLNDSTAKYVLGSDLTQGDSDTFESIGYGGNNLNHSFTGKFNGLGHSITDLTISEDGDWNNNVPNGVGLFANIAEAANISNLALINPTVTNTHSGDIAPTGALVGYAVANTVGDILTRPTISNIIISGATVTTGGVAGGAIGQIENSIVKNVNVSTSNVSGGSRVGGVVGYMNESNVDNLSSVGNTIAATRNGAGGIVGEVGLDSNTLSSITNSNASRNTISAAQDVGGILGKMDYTDLLDITLSNNYYKLNDTSLNTNLGAITYGGIYEGQYNTWLAGSKAALVVSDYLGEKVGSFYEINNMQDFRNLLAFADSTNTDIIIKNDITLDAGFYLPMFQNMINGQNHTISGLNINQSYNANIGFIGVFRGLIEDLTIASPTLSGYSNVGSLAGMFLGGGIANATATGVNISIDALDKGVSNIGGLVGYATPYTAIFNSSASGAIAINLAGNIADEDDDYYIENIGGLVGLIEGSSNEELGYIVNVESKTTDVSITIGANQATTNSFSVDSIGGLVGRNDVESEDYEYTISNAKATGNIIISSANTAGVEVDRIGGAVGYSRGSLYAITANNDITINIDDYVDSVGGIVGRTSGLYLVSGNYSGDISITSTDGSIERVGGIAGRMTRDYSTIGNSTSAGTITLTTSSAENIGGAVGEADSGTNFINIISSVDIDANNVDYGENIGGLVGYNFLLENGDESFGNISGSSATGDVTASHMNKVGGLVGYSEYGSGNANISNSFATGKVTGYYQVGGLVGDNSEGSVITNSYATGDVVSINNTAGGLVGENKGSIVNSYANGKVTSENGNDIGGLVGDNFGLITGSHATGEVIATNGWGVGGLVGYQYLISANAILSNSYATGKVTGNEAVGGLVGGSDDVNILNSYSTGEVIGNSQVGGLAGYFEKYNLTSVFMEKSYATGKVTGASQIGGLIGYTKNADVENVFSTGEVINTIDSSAQTGALIGMSVNGSVKNSYASGLITVGVDADTGLGGLIGQNDDSFTTVEHSFYNKTLNAGKSDEVASGKTTEELKSMNTFTNWSIANDSTLTVMYPRLASSGSLTAWVINSAATGSGGGSNNNGGATQTQTPVQKPIVQETNVQKVITSIVNNTINNVNLPKDILLPKVNVGSNMPILPMAQSVQASPMMQNLGKKLGLNQGEQLSLVSTVLEGQATQKITLGELKDLSDGSNNPNERRNTPLETRVALGDNSIVELVNGGVSLPEGVDQEFYITKNKKIKNN